MCINIDIKFTKVKLQDPTELCAGGVSPIHEPDY